MNTYSFTTTDKHDLGAQTLVDRYNGNLPRDTQGALMLPEMTLEGFVRQQVMALFDGWYNTYLEDTAEKQKRAWLAAQRGDTTLNELEQARQAKLSAVQAAYQSKLAAGITPTGSEIVLAALPDDVEKFTQLITLLREVESLQPTDEAKAAFRDSLQTVADINGTPHQLTVSALREMIVDYGIQVNTLWAANAQKRAQIAAAITVEEINAIEV
jgi:hypothetical protein